MADEQLVREISDAITAHLVWKQRLVTAIETGKPQHSPIAAGSDRHCAFGKWLYGPKVSPQVQVSRPYAVVRRLHAGFHRSAGRILSLVEQGQIKQAQLTLHRDFEAQSDLLIRALQKWRRELAG